ncbi:hypothetical protein Golax_022266, partial [Gossypium laxum]|nr:hypothetical protein [Gossypium laxum]
MLSVFSSEPQNSTQILKLNVAAALHLGSVLCWTFTEFPSPPPAPPPEFEASGFTNFYETAENLSGTCIQLAMGLQLLKASPTVMSLEICFELKMRMNNKGKRGEVCELAEELQKLEMSKSHIPYELKATPKR